MATLKQAINLLGLEDEESVYLLPCGEHFAFSTIISVKEIRRKLDMKKIIVHRVDLHFDRNDGEFMGFIFNVTGFDADIVRKRKD